VASGQVVARYLKSDPRRFPLDPIVAALLGSAAFALYLASLAPTVLAGDGGEFQFVPYLLGVAHPTGYPLYCLLGWAWSHLLPFGDVAYRMNLFSAFWAALAVALLYPTVQVLLRLAMPQIVPAICRLLAALATVTFAVTPTFWSQSVIAEVYGLHVFFVVALLFFLLLWTEHRKPRFLLLAFLFFGMSLTHHRTSLLLAPAILAYIWLTERRIFRQGRQAALLLAACCLPLALYLYIPLRAPHTPYLHLSLAEGHELVLYENTLASFFNFVLGGPFGGSLDFSVDLGARLAMAWSLLLGEVGWIGVGLALLGLMRLAATRKWALLALTGLLYGATVAFGLVYTIGDVYVLFIPSYLVILLWLVVGVGTLVQVVTGIIVNVRSRLSPTFAPILVMLPFFALPLWLAAGDYTSIDQSHNIGARTRWESILAEPLPPNAVLVSNDRNNIMPMWYFQYVDGVRPDLLGLFPLITPRYPTLGPVLDVALDSERPVYLIKEMPGVEVKVEVEAERGLWRVLGPAVEGEPAYPMDARLADAVALAGYDLSPHSPQAGETLQVSLYWEALHPLEADYHTYVHLVDAEGNKVAQSDRQPGGVFYPTTLWQPSERLRDNHVLTVPADTPPGVYRLLAGMYTLSASGELGPLGEPLAIGEVAIK
jgi:hypothetical protein